MDRALCPLGEKSRVVVAKLLCKPPDLRRQQKQLG